MFAPQIAQLAKRLPRPAFSDCVLFFFFVFLQCAMTYLSGPLLPSCITHTSSRMYWSFIAMHATHARCRTWNPPNSHTVRWRALIALPPSILSLKI